MKPWGQFLRKPLNLGRNMNGGNPYWVLEFKGPDGLRYLASVFEGEGNLSVLCCPAPMRNMPTRLWEPELRAFIEGVEERISQTQQSAAQKDGPAPAASEPPAWDQEVLIEEVEGEDDEQFTSEDER